jgi:Fe-S oxidoreductase
MSRDPRALSRALDREVPVCDVGTYGDGKAQCCGYPLYVDGQLDLVEENFLKLADVLGGHDLVVTPDPGCAYMLSTVQSVLVGRRGKARTFPATAPLVDVLAQHADRFAGASPGLVVRYHDACYLGRRGRSFDAPRALLERATGQPPLELHKNRDQADCSGSGGLYPLSNPDGARDAARRAVTADGNAHVSADVVVTGCPSARRGFERANVRVRDLIDVILGET